MSTDSACTVGTAPYRDLYSTAFPSEAHGEDTGCLLTDTSCGREFPRCRLAFSPQYKQESFGLGTMFRESPLQLQLQG